MSHNNADISKTKRVRDLGIVLMNEKHGKRKKNFGTPSCPKKVKTRVRGKRNEYGMVGPPLGTPSDMPRKRINKTLDLVDSDASDIHLDEVDNSPKSECKTPLQERNFSSSNAVKKNNKLDSSCESIILDSPDNKSMVLPSLSFIANNPPPLILEHDLSKPPPNLPAKFEREKTVLPKLEGNTSTHPVNLKEEAPNIVLASKPPILLLDNSIDCGALSKSEMSINFNDSTSSFDSPAMKKKLPVKSRLSIGANKAIKKLVKKAVTKPKGVSAGKILKVKKETSSVKPSRATKVLKKVSKTVDEDIEILFEWDPASVISERQQVTEWQTRQVISLLDQECTLPFIARYRREKTGNLDIEKLREVHNAYQQLKEVKKKVSKVLQETPESLNLETKKSLLNATSVLEVKTLTSSLRSKGERTYADRARKLGLADAAESILTNKGTDSHEAMVHSLVCPNKDGKKTQDEVETGIKYIIADTISKDPKMMAFMKNGLKNRYVKLTASKSRKATSSQKPKPVKKVIAKRKSLGAAKPAKAPGISPEVIAKYESYFKYSSNAWTAQPHVVCALNRGEQQGILSVKVELPSYAYTKFVQWCSDHFLGALAPDDQGEYFVPYRRKLLLSVLPDCWDRLVQPSLQSWVRSELSDAAELASIKIFNSNLRRLLLTPPVRASTVLAIDPGFAAGCKLALVERKGKVLAVDTIFPFKSGSRRIEAENKLISLIVDYKCDIVCIGNGTACRETETFLSNLIKRGAFGSLQVQYTIISEAGASQYSVTDDAKTEFPDMDINHISAVSLARRLQDPLLEYVKVPPMHLGVGMYQHDVSSKLLGTSLDLVMMECVSFVGVDLNVASEIVLRKVSGLNKSRAAAIVKHRDENGAFRNREEIKKVKGIGPISYQQCAGFVRIVPQTVRQSSLNHNLSSLCPLDSTTVHPESYDSAFKLISQAKLDAQEIGSDKFISNLKLFVDKMTFEDLAANCGCSEESLKCILESLYQPTNFDFRGQFDKPLFRQGVKSLSDLKAGDVMNGHVRNVTSFGAFVDIGVGDDGLIHTSKMRMRKLELGNIVKVMILNIEMGRKRISLDLLDVL